MSQSTEAHETGKCPHIWEEEETEHTQVQMSFSRWVQTGGFQARIFLRSDLKEGHVTKSSQLQDPCVVSQELRPLYKNGAHLHLSFGPSELVTNSESKHQAYVKHVLTISGLECSLGIANCLYFGGIQQCRTSKLTTAPR